MTPAAAVKREGIEGWVVAGVEVGEAQIFFKFCFGSFNETLSVLFILTKNYIFTFF